MCTSRIVAVALFAMILSGGSARPGRANQVVSMNLDQTVAVLRGGIQIRAPEPNSKVRSAFEFAGRAQPNAVVTIEASTSDTSSDGDAKATFRKQTRADERGNFSVEVAVANAEKYIHVHAQSVAPDGSSAHTTQSFAVAH